MLQLKHHPEAFSPQALITEKLTQPKERTLNVLYTISKDELRPTQNLCCDHPLSRTLTLLTSSESSSDECPLPYRSVFCRLNLPQCAENLMKSKQPRAKTWLLPNQIRFIHPHTLKKQAWRTELFTHVLSFIFSTSLSFSHTSRNSLLNDIDHSRLQRLQSGLRQLLSQSL